MISDLVSHLSLPWLIGDDLNEIFIMLKKGPPKPLSDLDSIRNVFIDTRLFDVSYSGYNFTWCNYRNNGVLLEERLDQFCANTD